jgi:tRNA-dihydrouridine synthase
MNFWQDLPQPFFVLAPMEDVTDVVFRHVVAKAARPDVFFTEFTNAASFMSERGELSTRGRLVFTEDEQPMVAQIWGKSPDNFREMAIALREKGFAGIDINTGCPDKSVVKNGSGSALIENPELTVSLIQAAKESGLPISVKTRLGVRNPEEFREWLPVLLRENLANLTVHLRTRKEMSKVPAHFELIPEIVKLRDDIAPDTKLTINGDVRDRAHGLELIEQYSGIDGIMIGRGIFANPFAFENEAREHSKEELFELLHYHLDLYDQYREIAPDVYRKFDPLKRFFKIYVRDFDGAKELREQMMNAKTTDEVREIVYNNNDELLK